MSLNTDVLQNTPDLIKIMTTMDQAASGTAASQLTTANPILHPVAGKHQMLPLVYIQTQPNQKLNSASNTPTSNVILPQIQLQNLTPIQPKTNQSAGVILGKAPIVLQKAANVQKNGVTYLTMLKPVSKPPDNIIANRLPLTTISKIKTESTIQMLNNQGKIMIAPMPSVTTNRLAVTATTNSVQPKFSFMPLVPKPKGNLINLKIEGGVQPDEMKLLDGDLTITAVESKPATEMIAIEDAQTDVVDGKFDVETVREHSPEEKFPVAEVPFDDPTKPHPNTKEVKIHTSETLPLPTQTSTPIQTPVAPVTTKRSRKSTLCLRKDYHEIELEPPTKKVDDEDKKVDMEVDMITSKNVTAADFNFNILLDEDIAEFLNWDAGIGTLPGTCIKFYINEFGFLEFITKEEYQKMQVIKAKKEKKEKKERKSLVAQLQEEMRCLECGCFGMANEFINPKYCSVDCMNRNSKRNSLSNSSNNTCNRKRSFTSNSVTPPSSTPTNVPVNNVVQKKRKVENGDLKDSKEPSSDDDASVITNVSHDRNQYPWQCRKKGFSWAKYLAHINAIGAPVKLFKDPFPYNRNGFRPGMKLEGIDPQHPSYFCVLTVAQVQGYRLQLHFDGYPQNYDFWTNADSMDIFPAGFCEKHDHVLHPPPNYPDFNWNAYLKFTKSTAAPKHLFTNRTGSVIFPTGFRTGMKLEAVDRKNTSLICVATAKDLLDSRILVHFDSWDDIYDYWADPSSHYIHPVGWCDKNGHRLTPPNDHPDPENFTWEKYLKDTNSVAAPTRAFKQRPISGFKKGMRLECVDKRVPQLIRVASVLEVKEHRLRISFDGWPDRYSYWVDDDSPDIHPVGWCQKTGHPIESPLTPDDVYDFLECATVGCRGVGNINGPHFATHNNQKFCPYAEENIDSERVYPDRLRSPDRELEEAVPISREPKIKKSNPKKKYETDVTKTEWLDESDLKEKEFKRKPRPVVIKKDLLQEDINPEELKMRVRHSKYYKSYVKSVRTDPCDWSARRVSEYVRSLPFIKENADVFARNSIDGESFLMLTQQDLIEILNFKLGPAIALYNCILMLRQSMNSCI